MLEPSIWWNLHIYSWRDIIECLLLSGTIYYISLWLRRDTQKPLLLSFYGYCLILFGSHYTGLTTLSHTLILFSPALFVGFIVLHQETLQRNFVMLHNISPSHTTTESWIDELMRAALIAVSSNKEIRCLIEKRDSLEAVLHSPVAVECSLTQSLLTMLIESNTFLPHHMITFSSDGLIKTINSSWKKTSVEEWLAKEAKEQEQWLQDALFFTAKTDALFFRIDPTTRTTTLVAQGKIIEKVSAHSALRTIKQYLIPSSSEKVYYEQNKKPSPEQSLS